MMDIIFVEPKETDQTVQMRRLPNIFTNPDLGNPASGIAVVPEIFKQRLNIVTETAGLDRERLLMWICAWCGLSAAWSLESNAPVTVTTKIAELALPERELRLTSAIKNQP